jgi:hypothetical protein
MQRHFSLRQNSPWITAKHLGIATISTVRHVQHVRKWRGNVLATDRVVYLTGQTESWNKTPATLQRTDNGKNMHSG